MATVGTHAYPQNFYMWYIEGDDLIIVTDETEDGTTVRGYLQSPQETITDGLLIHYLAEPNAVTAVTDYPDIDNTLHKYIVDFVKAEFYMEEAGKAAMNNNENKSVLLERLARRHEKRWTDELVKFGVSKRDKVGGSRHMMVIDYR